MVSIIKQYPMSVKIRASWRSVQKALFDTEKARSVRRRHVAMSGESNLLFTGAKAIHHGNGIWFVHGYSSNGSDLKEALERMGESWRDRVVREGKLAA